MATHTAQGQRQVPAVAPPAPVLVPGLAGGLLGGLAMAATMAIGAALGGLEPLDPLWPLADTFAGPGAGERGAGRFAAGFLIHLAFSGAVGVAFMVALPGDLAPHHAAAMGVGYALLLLAIMTSSVLPSVNPALRSHMPALGGTWVIAHALYGLVAGGAGQALRHRRWHPRGARARPPLPASGRPSEVRP